MHGSSAGLRSHCQALVDAPWREGQKFLCRRRRRRRRRHSGRFRRYRRWYFVELNMLLMSMLLLLMPVLILLLLKLMLTVLLPMVLRVLLPFTTTIAVVAVAVAVAVTVGVHWQTRSWFVCFLRASVRAVSYTHLTLPTKA